MDFVFEKEALSVCYFESDAGYSKTAQIDSAIFYALVWNREENFFLFIDGEFYFLAGWHSVTASLF